jgi:hypothetical protein
MRGVIMKCWRRIGVLAATVLSAAGLIFTAPASAATTRHFVQTSLSAMASTNDKVDALAYAKGVVYAGGMFTRMRFRGTSYIRQHLGAVHSASGRPTSFRPAVNGEVLSMAVSPDQKVLYIGGHFTAVGKAARSDVAAFRISTGKLTSFAPAAGGPVRAIAVTSGGVYLGGNFHRVNGQVRTFAAEVNGRGKLTSWAPALDGSVRALLVSPDKTRVFLGGGFRHVNGVAFEALGSVSATTGANENFRNGLIPTYTDGRTSAATSLTTNGTWIFAGAEGTGLGAFDGTLAFRPGNGKLVWRNTCLGATQAVLYLRGVLYKASHAHDCSSAGGFGQIPTGWQPHRLLAENTTNGKLLRWGTSGGAVRQPLPDTNAGLHNKLGPFALATDGKQLFVAGEFTGVNTQRQEGLARFGG